MERAKLTTLAVDRAHRSGKPMLLSDGDGLYLRKQTRDGASWTLRYPYVPIPRNSARGFQGGVNTDSGGPSTEVPDSTYTVWGEDSS